MAKLPRKTSFNRKYFSIFLLIIFVFFIGNLIWRLPGWIKLIQKPFQSEESVFANGKKIDFSSRTNLLLLNEKKGILSEILVASYDPAGKQIVFLSIPPEAKIQIGDQTKSLKSICARNFSSCFWQLALLSGSNLEGYLVFDEASLSNENLLDARKNLFSLAFFLHFPSEKTWLDAHLKTSLTTNQLYQAGTKLKGVNTESIKFLDLGEAVTGGSFDSSRVEDFTKDIFIDSAVADEASSVSIVNSTGEDGLGSTFKRIVDNLGGRVVSVESGTNGKTKVILHSDKGKLAEALANFLSVPLEKSSTETKADIEVILGSDLTSKVSEN